MSDNLDCLASQNMAYTKAFFLERQMRQKLNTELKSKLSRSPLLIGNNFNPALRSTKISQTNLQNAYMDQGHSRKQSTAIGYHVVPLLTRSNPNGDFVLRNQILNQIQRLKPKIILQNEPKLQPLDEYGQRSLGNSSMRSSEHSPMNMSQMGSRLE